MPSIDFLALLKFGMIGGAIGLAIQAAYLIHTEQKRKAPNELTLRTIHKYMAFAIALAVVGIVSEAVQLYFKNPPAPALVRASPIAFLKTLGEHSPAWRVFPKFTVNDSPDGLHHSVSVASYRKRDAQLIEKFFNALDSELKVSMGSFVQPRVLLMDSPIRKNVYSKFAFANGATNADSIDTILRDRSTLNWKVFKETTNKVWNRYDRVNDLDPDIIIVHASAFWDNTEEKNERSRFVDFLKAVAPQDAKVLVYSRNFVSDGYRTEWLRDMRASVPQVADRLHQYVIPGSPQTFEISGPDANPQVAANLRSEIQKILSEQVRAERQDARGRLARAEREESQLAVAMSTGSY